MTRVIALAKNFQVYATIGSALLWNAMRLEHVNTLADQDHESIVRLIDRQAASEARMFEVLDALRKGESK